jgi:hypothetical protein
LLFHRKKTAAESFNSKKLKQVQPIAPDELEEMNIEDLIVGELEHSDKKLELFDEKRMSNALDNYVQKQDVQAIPEAVSNLLGKQQKKLIQRAPDDVVEPDENDMDATPRKAGGARKRSQPEPDEDEEEEAPSPRGARKKRTATATKSTARKPARSRKHGVESEDEVEEVAVKPKASKRASPRSRKNTASYQESDDDDERIEEVPSPKPRNRRTAQKKLNYSRVDSDSDVVEVIEEEPPKKKVTRGTRSRKTSAPSSSQSSRLLSQSQLSFEQVKKRPSRKTSINKYTDDDDNEDLTPSHNYELDDDWGTAKTDTFKS